MWDAYLRISKILHPSGQSCRNKYLCLNLALLNSAAEELLVLTLYDVLLKSHCMLAVLSILLYHQKKHSVTSQEEKYLSLWCKHKVSLVQSILYPGKSFKDEWLCGHLMYSILLVWSHTRMPWQMAGWELIHTVVLQSLVTVNMSEIISWGYSYCTNCHML